MSHRPVSVLALAALLGAALPLTAAPAQAAVVPAASPSSGPCTFAEDGSTLTVTVKNEMQVKVEVFRGQTLVGETMSERADPARDHVLTVNLTPSMANGETLRLHYTDLAGNEGENTCTAADSTAPSVKAEVDQTTGESISGTSEAGATITVKDPSGTVLGTTEVGADGTWTLALKPAQTAGQVLSVTAVDAAENSATTSATAPTLATPEPTPTPTPTPEPTPEPSAPETSGSETNTPEPSASETPAPTTQGTSDSPKPSTTASVPEESAPGLAATGVPESTLALTVGALALLTAGGAALTLRTRRKH